MSWPRTECPEAGDTTGLPEDLGCACVLLALNAGPASRDELRARLLPLGPATGGDARVDGTLRDLQQAGLVWADDAAAMRCSAGAFGLTREGLEHVGPAADNVRGAQVLLSRFLARAGERLGGWV